MPTPSLQIPRYRLHRPSGRAVVTLNGRDCYLGVHGTAASRAEYDRLLHEWLANGRRVPDRGDNSPSITVDQLLVAYWNQAKDWYRKNGQPTSHAHNVQDAMRPLHKSYGLTPVDLFGPLALKGIRETFIERGLCRSSVNKHIGTIKRIFRWGTENELVPSSVFQALQAVTPTTGTTGSTTSVSDAVVGDQTSSPVTAAAIPDPPAETTTSPKRPRTPAQAEAARRNGAKSRGPKTEAGKAVSKYNAVKHGILARTLRPSPQSDWIGAGDYDAVLAGLIDEYQPRTTSQYSLIELMAHTFVQLARCNMWITAVTSVPVEMPWRMDYHPAVHAERCDLLEHILEELPGCSQLACTKDQADELAELVSGAMQWSDAQLEYLVETYGDDDTDDEAESDRLEAEELKQTQRQLANIDAEDIQSIRAVLTGQVCLSATEKEGWTAILEATLDRERLRESAGNKEIDESKSIHRAKPPKNEALAEMLLYQGYARDLARQLSGYRKELMESMKEK